MEHRGYWSYFNVPLTLEQLNDLIDACHARAYVLDEAAIKFRQTWPGTQLASSELEKDAIDYRNLAEYLRRYGE